MATVNVDAKKIKDWKSFHLVFMDVMGFPGFYGMNLNAWIDCMRDLGEDTGMNKFRLDEDEMLYVHIFNTKDFSERLPQVLLGLVECTAFVNQSVVSSGKKLRLVLVFR